MHTALARGGWQSTLVTKHKYTGCMLCVAGRTKAAMAAGSGALLKLELFLRRGFSSEGLLRERSREDDLRRSRSRLRLRSRRSDLRSRSRLRLLGKPKGR